MAFIPFDPLSVPKESSVNTTTTDDIRGGSNPLSYGNSVLNLSNFLGNLFGGSFSGAAPSTPSSDNAVMPPSSQPNVQDDGSMAVSPSSLGASSQMLSGGLGAFGTSMMRSMYGMGYGRGYSPYGGGYGMSPFMGFGGYSPYSSSFGGSPYGSRGLMGLGLGSYGMGYNPYGMGYGSMYSMMPYGLGGYIPQSYGSDSQSQGSAPV